MYVYIYIYIYVCMVKVKKDPFSMLVLRLASSTPDLTGQAA